MRLSEFQHEVIEHAIRGAHEDYRDEPQKRDGAIAGLEACRSLNARQLGTMLVAANTALSQAYAEKSPRYWEVAMFHAEVEWVCDCVSAVLLSMGSAPIISPTARGYAKAAEIIGIDNVRKLSVAQIRTHQ